MAYEIPFTKPDQDNREESLPTIGIPKTQLELDQEKAQMLGGDSREQNGSFAGEVIEIE